MLMDIRASIARRKSLIAPMTRVLRGLCARMSQGSIITHVFVALDILELIVISL